MKRVIPAGRIAIAIWMAAAVTLALAMSVCSSCRAEVAETKVSCAPMR